MAKKKAVKKAAVKKAVKSPKKKPVAQEQPAPVQAATMDAEDNRTVRFPVTKFCKPGYEVSEETGDESVQIKVKVPSSHCDGDSAVEFFGKKRCRIRFTRRSVGEWGQGQIVTDGKGQIFECESEIPSFGWSNGDFHFSFWTDRISFEAAKSMYRKGGSIELTVLGEPLSGDPVPQSTAPSAKPGKPTKKAKEPKSATKGPTIPGTTPEELADNHSVALSDRFRVDIKIVALPEGGFSCQWSGEGPAGECSEGEPSIRKSPVHAAAASLGKAVDFWSAYPGDEEKQILETLRTWLRELEGGKKTVAAIESELSEDEESEGDDE